MKKSNYFIFTIFGILAIVLIFFNENSCNAATVNSQQIDQLKSQFLPPEYQNTNFTLDDIKKMYHARCKKVLGTDNATLYKEIEDSSTTLTTCVSSLLNVTLIQEEMEVARGIGELDTVFHKYCLKAPAFEDCIIDFNEKVQPCLTKEEQKQNAVFMRVLKNFLGFVCAKGGDQIALFVAEQGPECIEANKEAISNCANNSFSEYWPKDGKMPDLLNLPQMVLSPEHCVDFEVFEKCTLHHLEQCQDITPANVAESVFKFLKNETSCRAWIDAKANERPVLRESKTDGANAMTILSTFVVAFSAFAVILLQQMF